MSRPALSDASAPTNPMPLLDQRVPLACKERTRLPVALRTLSGTILVVCLLLAIGLSVLPWQQSVRGAGRVIAYDPLERSVTLEAPLSGRVKQARVLEGQPVQEGDLLFELVDNDPELRANLEQQREATLARKQAAEARVSSLTSQIADQERGILLAVQAARKGLEVAQFAETTARLHYNRVRALFEDERGLASRRDFELATLERDRTAAQTVQERANLERTEADRRSLVNRSQASLESARSDLAAVDSALAALSIRINQAGMQQVLAPRTGVVFRVQANEGTFLKEGSPLCTIIPETQSRMVELYMDGNDMPLIRSRDTDVEGRVLQEGSPVRLQFEGWPAVQFVGWPSVALGTFGGEVVSVDPTDSGRGLFRILVAPKPDRIEQADGSVEIVEWPGPRWLRQGVQAKGWVLLRQVPLWFELWRQMNGFPPSLSVADGKADAAK